MSLTISAAQIVAESDSPLLQAPDSWSRRPLGEVATILNGFAFKSKQFVSSGGVPLIRIRDISKKETAVCYAGDYAERYLVRPDELLVGMDGDFNCARWAGPEALLNQRVCKITPDPDVLDLDYLTIVLPGYLQAIHDSTSSTTVTHLSSRDLAEVPLPVPGLDEQRTIAKTISATNARRSSSTSHLENARRAVERFRQTVRVAACSGRLTADFRDVNELSDVAGAPSDLPPIPPSWSYKTAQSIAAEGIPISYGIVLPGPEVPDGVPYVRQQDVFGGTVLVSQLRRTSTAIAARHERSALEEGDVLLCIIRHLRVAIVPPGIDGSNITQGMVRIRPGAEICGPYLALYLECNAAQRWMKDKYVGLAMPRINVADARAIPVPVPPIDEQREIVTRASALLAIADDLTGRIEKASYRIELSEQAVLAKALRGELAPAEHA